MGDTLTTTDGINSLAIIILVGHGGDGVGITRPVVAAVSSPDSAVSGPAAPSMKTRTAKREPLDRPVSRRPGRIRAERRLKANGQVQSPRMLARLSRRPGPADSAGPFFIYANIRP